MKDCRHDRYESRFAGWSTTKLLRHARKREMDAAAQAQVERDRVHRLALLRVADTWRICQRMLLRRLAMERRV